MSEVFKNILAQLSAQGDTTSPLVRWGGVLIALIILWFAMVEPFLIWRAERMEALSSRIGKVERMVAMQKGADAWLSSEKDYSEAIQAAGSLFVSGDSYAIVQSKLAILLRNQAEAFNMQVKTQHLRDSESVPGLGEAVGVDLQLQGHLEGALALIDALVRSPRLLTIDSLYIAPVQGMHGSSLRGDPTVILMIGVRSYRLQGAQ